MVTRQRLTDEERNRRQAEVYAARDSYEQLLATYERDTSGSQAKGATGDARRRDEGAQ